MILIDANILIYAHVNSFAQHSRAREWLNQQLNAAASTFRLPCPHAAVPDKFIEGVGYEP